MSCERVRGILVNGGPKHVASTSATISEEFPLYVSKVLAVRILDEVKGVLEVRMGSLEKTTLQLVEIEGRQGGDGSQNQVQLAKRLWL